MRHQAIASWKQQVGGEFGMVDWGCLMFKDGADVAADLYDQTDILMLQADFIL